MHLKQEPRHGYSYTGPGPGVKEDSDMTQIDAPRECGEAGHVSPTNVPASRDTGRTVFTANSTQNNTRRYAMKVKVTPTYDGAGSWTTDCVWVAGKWRDEETLAEYPASWCEKIPEVTPEYGDIVEVWDEEGKHD